MSSSETITSPIPTPVVLPNRHRESIDWTENYGHTFKVVQRPVEEETIEDSTLIVTPKNQTEWNTWTEVSEHSLCKLKRNWEIIQKNLSEHKYKEILYFVKHI